MRQIALWVNACCLSLFVSPCLALESFQLQVDEISANGFKIRNATLQLKQLSHQHSIFTLKSGELLLPAPLNQLKVIQLSCGQFQWSEGQIHCHQGRGKISHKNLGKPEFDFSLLVKDNKVRLNITRLPLLSGRINLQAQERDGRWQVKLNAKKLSLSKIKQFFAIKNIQEINGSVAIQANLKGRNSRINAASVNINTHKVSLSSLDDKLLTDALAMQLTLNASHKKKWHWQSHLNISKGGLFFDPLFIDFNQLDNLNAHLQGTVDLSTRQINLSKFQMDQGTLFDIHGQAKLALKSTPILSSARVNASIPVLVNTVPVYLWPFWETGIIEQLGLSGGVQTQIDINNNQLVAAELHVEQLGITDPKQRIALQQAEGMIYWHQTRERRQASYIKWQNLKVKAVPVDAGRLDFAVYGKQFDLIRKAHLPMLGGEFTIEHFGFEFLKVGDADVHFKGKVTDLSLAQLAEAMNWKPLTGVLNGVIPSVRYRDKKLDLDGELVVNAFDGEVRISKLASSGMFTDFARFYTELEFNNLDLHALTHKFDIGGISGRLSGFAKNVYLENWQPVSFYAWLGTPEGDDSEHRISQRAVNNIASIGGGGAVDALSRSFMRFFEEFSYDELGMGCYLKNGVCQVMGVQAAENGYYLVKGGGLPRIDVIGYNPRIDWNVLMQRLQRVLNRSQIVVQ